MRWIAKNGKVYMPVNLDVGNGRFMQTTTHIADCSAADDPSRTADFIASAPEMLAMLKRLEFSGEASPWNYCHICGADSDEGHQDKCALAALIAKAEGRGDVHREG